MRYLPLTPDDRADMLKTIGAPSIDALFTDVPKSARRDGVVDLPLHAGELEVERELAEMAGRNRAAGEGAVLLRRGGLQAPRAGQRRSPDPALGILDILHALPARDRPGHAAGAV